MSGSTTSNSAGTMKNGTTGPAAQSSMPSSKDASPQGANTAGSAERNGDATTPGATMKKIVASIRQLRPWRRILLPGAKVCFADQRTAMKQRGNRELR